MRKDVEQSLNKFEVNIFGNKANIERLEEKLKETENVIYISPTNATITTIGTNKIEKLPGVFALTSQRIIFAYKVGFSHSFYTCDLSEIKMINCHGNGLAGGHIKIHTLILSFDILVKYKKEIIENIQKSFDDTIEKYKQENSVNSLINKDDDIIDQIKKLSDLKEKGILTEEEFTSKKSDLLLKL